MEKDQSPLSLKNQETSQNCPLCGQIDAAPIVANNKKSYHICNNCSLIYMDRSHLVSRQEERKVYSLHENSIEQPGYVNFLKRAILPALEFIKGSDVGLDYGCGPNPTLSQIMKNKGITCYDYDPIFNFSDPFDKYDFIFATECFEHFHEPKKEIIKILSKLNSKSLLIVMTQLYDNINLFPSWHYTQDSTHVSFYHLDTFEYIKNKFGLALLFTDGKRVLIFRKN